MKKTILDVAKHANVSKTTVSRYLNGKYSFMSNETKERIKKSIEILEYIPNGMARSLKNNRSKIIGCMIADIENQFSSYIFKGISEVCQKKGYRVLVMEISNHEEDEIKAIESLISYNIDGLIINTSGSNDEYILKLKNEKPFPIVLADRSISYMSKIDTVTINNYNATYNAMQHLKEQEFDEVAFFTYDLTNNIRNLRHNAYKEAMRNIFNIKDENLTYIFKEKDKEFLEKKILEFLKRNDSRKAIFSVNGKALLEILQTIKRLGLDIEKDDIGICSFDDWGWAELVDKEGITTILQNSYECGKRCAELIFERLENNINEVQYIELPSKLMVRGSTKNRRKK